jgi:hypothetical protein
MLMSSMSLFIHYFSISVSFIHSSVVYLILITMVVHRTIVDGATFGKTSQKRKFSLRQLQGMTTIVAAAIVWLNCLWMFMYNNNSNDNITQPADVGGDGVVSTIISSVDNSKPASHERINAEMTVSSSRRETTVVRFLFVIGLEGTGHHLLQSMASQSPAIEQLREMNIYPTMTKRLGKLLYGDPDPPPESRTSDHRPSPPSLWGSMDSCAVGGNGATFETHHQHDDEVVNDRGKPSVEEKLIELLRAIERKANSAQARGEEDDRQQPQQQQQRVVTIPFNVLRTLFTMASYPHLQGKCRGLRYPDLDLWYHVCERAGVKCEHVYIHRDPYEILYSTNVKRKNNRSKTPLYVIHLYKSMLSIIYAQLAAHANRTVGCYGMFARGNNVSQWKYQVGDLLGWTDKSAYDEFFANEYSPPKPNGNLTQYKRELAQPAYASAMQSLVTLNDRVKQLCESTATAPMPVLVAPNAE